MRTMVRFLAGTLMVMMAAPALAAYDYDICLIAYPQEESVYHYKDSRYFTVGPGHELYDPAFDIDGEVLINSETGEIAWDVYRANVVGFEPSHNDWYGFEIHTSPYHLVIEALSEEPAVYVNILLAFAYVPAGCHPMVRVNGELVDGARFALGDLVVNTQGEDGDWFGKIVVEMSFAGCEGANIWAFSDVNGDLGYDYDEGECTSSYLYHVFVPATESTFSAVKQLYR
ncbi:MAG: hypothetical protein JW819_05745 [Candidatus Krumholzibacteriota bacterium]|nr:hypothetical protein [Candidatus Krumholzibacteriota bacterium]